MRLTEAGQRRIVMGRVDMSSLDNELKWRFYSNTEFFFTGVRSRGLVILYL